MLLSDDSSNFYRSDGTLNANSSVNHYLHLGAEAAESEEDKDKNGLASSVLSLVCTTVGAGVLAIPSGMVPIGWLGLFLIFLVSLTCVITANYLVLCQHIVPGRPFKTYEDIGEAAFPRFGRTIVAVVQLITLIGVPAIFLILIGSNMNALVPQLTQHVWAFIFAAIMIPIAWIRTMKEISLLAYFGVFASFFVAAFVVVRGIQILVDGDFLTDIGGIPHANGTIPHSTSVFIGSGIPEAINTIVFGFGGQSVIPNIVSEMKSPMKYYKRFTFWSYFTIGIVYCLVAGFGYAAWGSDCQSNILDSINGISNGISLGSPPTIVHIFGQLSRAIIVIHLLTAYPILLNPVSLYFEQLFNIPPSSMGQSKRLFLRTGLVLFTLALASTIPFFGDILQLVSSLSLIIVAFVFPPVFYYYLYRPTYDFPLWEKLVMILILIGGTLSSIIGCYYAVKDLIHDIENESPFDHYFSS